ncbi:hypothetical protein KL941_000279 [Ogataea angusta]|nr:hypothetical protein KL941_000279 [Ogataea angusta]
MGGQGRGARQARTAATEVRDARHRGRKAPAQCARAEKAQDQELGRPDVEKTREKNRKRRDPAGSVGAEAQGQGHHTEHRADRGVCAGAAAAAPRHQSCVLARGVDRGARRDPAESAEAVQKRQNDPGAGFCQIQRAAGRQAAVAGVVCAAGGVQQGRDPEPLRLRDRREVLCGVAVGQRGPGGDAVAGDPARRAVGAVHARGGLPRQRGFVDDVRVARVGGAEAPAAATSVRRAGRGAGGFWHAAGPDRAVERDRRVGGGGGELAGAGGKTGAGRGAGRAARSGDRGRAGFRDVHHAPAETADRGMGTEARQVAEADGGHPDLVAAADRPPAAGAAERGRVAAQPGRAGEKLHGARAHGGDVSAGAQRYVLAHPRATQRRQDAIQGHFAIEAYQLQRRGGAAGRKGGAAGAPHGAGLSGRDGSLVCGAGERGGERDRRGIGGLGVFLQLCWVGPTQEQDAVEPAGKIVERGDLYN